MHTVNIIQDIQEFEGLMALVIAATHIHRSDGNVAVAGVILFLFWHLFILRLVPPSEMTILYPQPRGQEYLGPLYIYAATLIA